MFIDDKVVGHFCCKCPINFSLSRHSDKLKLIGHQTDPLPDDNDLNGDEDQRHESWYEKVHLIVGVVVPAARAGRASFRMIVPLGGTS